MFENVFPEDVINKSIELQETTSIVYKGSSAVASRPESSLEEELISSNDAESVAGSFRDAKSVGDAGFSSPAIFAGIKLLKLNRDRSDSKIDIFELAMMIPIMFQNASP